MMTHIIRACRLYPPLPFASSNINTDQVCFIFGFPSKLFIASYRPISRCLFRLVEIASSTFTTEKERLFPAFVFVRPLAVVGRPPPSIGSRPIMHGCNDATQLGPISRGTRASVPTGPLPSSCFFSRTPHVVAI